MKKVADVQAYQCDNHKTISYKLDTYSFQPINPTLWTKFQSA